MQNLRLSTLDTPTVSKPGIEIVERKGLGHPDTICDALAEELSRALCDYYLTHFGLVLHHNVDKALLWGGSSLPAFKGGEIQEPIEIFLAGRATREFKGHVVPLEDLVNETCSNWLHSHFHALRPEQHVKIHHLIRPGSVDLVELYLRQEKSGIAFANDTSCGVGYAPLSELERMVLHVEKQLNSAETKSSYPEYGEDIKIMGIQHDEQIELTVACAFVDRYIDDLDDYLQKKHVLADLIKTLTKTISNRKVDVIVNAADNPETKSLYLTVTGTSAESGDDGEVGRGNRVNGLITPYRPMNMEAAAGKNPVTHVGKLYNIIAQQIAISLVSEFDEIDEAYCYLLSQIGSPVSEPRMIDLKLGTKDKKSIDSIASRINAVVNEKLTDAYKIQQDIIDGKIAVY
jgi:S-adenosylmethionine synthetase